MPATTERTSKTINTTTENDELNIDYSLVHLQKIKIQFYIRIIENPFI